MNDLGKMIFVVGVVIAVVGLADVDGSRPGLVWKTAGRHQLFARQLQFPFSAGDVPDHQRGAHADYVADEEVTPQLARPPT
jgi:hypothetical protein